MAQLLTLPVPCYIQIYLECFNLFLSGDFCADSLECGPYCIGGISAVDIPQSSSYSILIAISCIWVVLCYIIVLNAVFSVIPKGKDLNKGDISAAKKEGTETEKLLAILKTVVGENALSWCNVTFKPSPDGPLLLKDSWGELKYGHVTAVMGPSGCGKSTLLNVLDSQVDGGVFSGSLDKHALLAGFTLLSPTLDGVGFVHQHGAGTVIESLTVFENFYFRAALFSRSKDSVSVIVQEAENMLERCGLVHRRDVIISSLSGGQLKRVAIGMELLGENSVVFLDEPTSGLDSAASLEIIKLLHSEARNYGKCIAVVIHQPRNELFEFMDDLLLCKAGRTLYCGSIATFQNEVLPQFLPSVHSNIGDRILDHVIMHDDLYVDTDASIDVSKVITTAKLKNKLLEKRAIFRKLSQNRYDFVLLCIRCLV
jgi:ABC-type multidrug transport system ATPase subunit